MKFSELPYKRADVKQAEEELKELTEELKRAESGEEQYKVHRRYYALEARVRTQEVIARFRYDGDMSDEFYGAEKKYYDEMMPGFAALKAQYRKALYESPYRKELEEKIGPVAFKAMELQFHANDGRLTELKKEENALQGRYMKCIAEARIPFDGEEKNISLLRPYIKPGQRGAESRASSAGGLF